MKSIVSSFALLLALVAPLSAQAEDLSPNPIVRGNQPLDLERCKNHFILRSADACATADASWVAASDMHEARSRHTATLLKDGTVLVAGGGVASVELYDWRDGSWTLTAPLKRAVSGHTATLLASGKVLVLGGGMACMCSAHIDNNAQIYDPETRQWTKAAEMQIHRGDFTATLLDTGKVLIVGGLDFSDQTVTRAELYDPETDTWAFTGLSSGLFWHTATKLRDGRVLIAGGALDEFLSYPIQRSEIYDPDSGDFTFAGNMLFPRALHAATLLDDGSVLLTGGYTRDHVATERYDPRVNGWILGASQNMARDGHTATHLPGGTVLLAGGMQSAIPNLAWSAVQSSEVLGANALTRNPEMLMRSARTDHTATLLPDGTVLVTGGIATPDFGDGTAHSLKSAEIYVPGTTH